MESNYKFNNETGMSKILAILLVIFIGVIVYFGVKWLSTEKETEKVQNVKANMLIIQGAIKKLDEKVKIENIMFEDDKKEVALIGTKLTDLGDNEIIEKFKELNVLTEEEWGNYYLLTNKDLEKLLKASKTDVKNEEGSYYLVEYEDDEVVITKGYEGKYKLSEMPSEELEDNTTNASKGDENPTEGETPPSDENPEEPSE